MSAPVTAIIAWDTDASKVNADFSLMANGKPTSFAMSVMEIEASSFLATHDWSLMRLAGCRERLLICAVIPTGVREAET